MKTAQYHGLSILRGLAAFGIVGTHLNLEPSSAAARIFLDFTDMGVGIFATVSGFLMMRSIDSSNFSFMAYIRKRAGRLLPTYFVWTLIYLIATCSFDMLLDGGQIDPRFSCWHTWVDIVFWGAGAVQLWFLIELLYVQILVAGAYRLFPRILRAISLPLCLAMIILSTAFRQHGHFFFYFVRLLAYVMGGIWLYLQHEWLKKQIRQLVIMVVAAIALHLLLRGCVPLFVRDFICALPIVALAIVLPIGASQFADFLARTSMGVFLVHALPAAFLGFLFRKHFSAPYGCWVVMADWVAVVALSLGVVLPALRIRSLQRIMT